MPLVLGGLLAVVLLVAVVFGGVLAALSYSTADDIDCGTTGAAPGSGQAPVADIPAAYLTLYRKAGAEYGIGWPVLAAVGSVESDHGRGEASGIRFGANSAGAMGPMQFLPGTWARYGVDGDHNGTKNVYDPADAIPGAANYLKANGAPRRMENALWHYNHADWYVRKVLAKAKEYADAGQGKISQPASADLCANTVSLPPNQVAAKVVGFARDQLGKPYVWGAAGPNAFDCSGLTWAAYRAAGITIPRVSWDQWQQAPHVPKGQEQPGDLVFFDSGPGTSPDRPGHVGIVIGGGKMIAAPHTGTVVQVQPYDRRSLTGFARPSAGHT